MNTDYDVIAALKALNGEIATARRVVGVAS
jgi:hypothetical protein